MERFRISIRKMRSISTKTLSCKKIFRKKNIHREVFVVCVNSPTFKIWGQSDQFPTSFTYLHYPLQVTKLIRGNSFKYDNQTSMFFSFLTSGQNLKPQILCQYLMNLLQ